LILKGQSIRGFQRPTGNSDFEYLQKKHLGALRGEFQPLFSKGNKKTGDEFNPPVPMSTQIKSSKLS